MVDLANADAVAILTRAPARGGKSRLFAALGMAPDQDLLEALLRDTLDGVAGAGVATVIAVTPAADVNALAAEFSPFAVIPQSDGSLGERMRHAMKAMFAAGARRVAIVGSDLPTLTSAIVTSAFDGLDREPGAVVLGPAHDGGYYLVAAAAVPPIFDGIEWGSASVLAETRARAARAGLTVVEIAAMRDIDTPEDLRAVITSAPRSRTAAWARRYCD